MSTILAMYSGGLDSLGMLYHIFNNKEYNKHKIHIHHVNIHNVEDRALAEKIAVNNTLRWFYNHNYKYTVSSSDMGFNAYNKKFLFDSDITNFMAGYICSCADDIVMITYGVNKNDLEDGTLRDKNKRANTILKAFTDVDKIYPIKHMTKQEIYDMLPADLREMSWSCRTPKYIDNIPVRCNECKTCEVLNELRSIG